jgi:hypothetical protein
MESNMQKLMVTLLMMSMAPVMAHDDDEIEFHQASELLPWCKAEAEAEAHFAGKGVATYQWTARYFERGNTLVVEGKLRADGTDVPVSCRVAKGARERYAVIELGAST